MPLGAIVGPIVAAVVILIIAIIIAKKRGAKIIVMDQYRYDGYMLGVSFKRITKRHSPFSFFRRTNRQIDTEAKVKVPL